MVVVPPVVNVLPLDEVVVPPEVNVLPEDDVVVPPLLVPVVPPVFPAWCSPRSPS